MAFASSAQAGITIPAGDWTVDIGGNVNAYYSNTNYSGNLFKGGKNTNIGSETGNTISKGLLPSALGIGAKTRQNDLDIAVQFTFFTGVNAANSANAGSGDNSGNGAQGNSLNIRQAYMSFGDASWGTIKAGRDLGVFGSDAILSDMTLLGVGIGAGGAGNSTLGRIGSGYAYADWMGQMTYQTPNWNGFQVTAGIREPWANATQSEIGYQGKATYDFAANDVTGRVWVSGLTQKIDGNVDAKAFDIGAKVAYQGFGLVGYYYAGENLGIPSLGQSGISPLGGLLFAANGDTSGGYVQGTFVVPGVGTKLGASWGTTMHKAGANVAQEASNDTWIIGAYHPLTKSLNLVAEYTNSEITNYGSANGVDGDGEARTASLGAILFF